MRRFPLRVDLQNRDALVSLCELKFRWFAEQHCLVVLGSRRIQIRCREMLHAIASGLFTYDEQQGEIRWVDVQVRVGKKVQDGGGLCRYAGFVVHGTAAGDQDILAGVLMFGAGEGVIEVWGNGVDV